MHISDQAPSLWFRLPEEGGKLGWSQLGVVHAGHKRDMSAECRASGPCFVPPPHAGLLEEHVRRRARPWTTTAAVSFSLPRGWEAVDIYNTLITKYTRHVAQDLSLALSSGEGTCKAPRRAPFRHAGLDVHGVDDVVVAFNIRDATAVIAVAVLYTTVACKPVDRWLFIFLASIWLNHATALPADAGSYRTASGQHTWPKTD